MQEKISMDNEGKNLDIIAQCIDDNKYIELDTERLEFKDISATGSWAELIYRFKNKK